MNKSGQKVLCVRKKGRESKEREETSGVVVAEARERGETSGVVVAEAKYAG